MEEYRNPILKFLCERQNHKIESNSKDIAFGISNQMIESILKDINEEPCKESPISKETLTETFNGFLKNALIKVYKGKKDKYIMSKKAYETVKVTMLEPPKPLRKKGIVIHENIQCRECLMIDGYTPTQTKCRYCGATLRRES